MYLARWAGSGMCDCRSLWPIRAFIQMFRAALIFHEHLLTMDDEWDMLWSRKLRASSWIFLSNRVAGVIYVLAHILRLAGDRVSALNPL